VPTPTVAVESPTLSRTVVDLLHREVNVAAGRLVRKLQLPVHHREDLRQELLVDLIARLKRFDPARGTLNAFASVIIRHRAGRLGKRINRERAIFAPMFLTDSLADDPTVATAFDTEVEANGRRRNLVGPENSRAPPSIGVSETFACSSLRRASHAHERRCSACTTSSRSQPS
jgi:DNA-directed RNA polymerase specialized sigma24 family protein